MGELSNSVQNLCHEGALIADAFARLLTNLKSLSEGIDASCSKLSLDVQDLSNASSWLSDRPKVITSFSSPRIVCPHPVPAPDPPAFPSAGTFSWSLSSLETPDAVKQYSSNRSMMQVPLASVKSSFTNKGPVLKLWPIWEQIHTLAM